MLKVSLIVLALAAVSAAQNGTIHGIVRAPNGSAISNAIISVQPATGNSLAKPVAITDSKGAFQLKQQPGKWKLCATAAGFALNCETLDLVPTGSIDLKLTLPVGPLANPIVQSAEDNPP